MFSDTKITDSDKALESKIGNNLTKQVELIKKSLLILGLSGSMFVTQAPVYAADTPSLQAANLLTKIQVQGQISVMVSLDVTVPDHISTLTGLEHDRALMAVMADAQNLLLQRLQDANVTVSNIVKLPYTPQIALTVTEEAFLQLRSDTAVDLIVENGSLEGDIGQSVPKIFPSVETSDFSGSGYTVAILDTGVDTNHFSFDGKIVAEACFSGAGNAALSFCPNGESEQIGFGAGINCDLTAPGKTGCDHGTHVAGIAVGANPPGLDSSFGTSHGVAKQANLIPIQVFSRTESSNGSIGNTALFADITMALSHVYALRNTPSVGVIAAVNLSLGGGGPFNTVEECNASNASIAMRPIIKMLKEANIATVIASGNNNFEKGIESPACIKEAIAVAASDNNDKKYDFCTSQSDTDCGSSSGELLDLWAPGVHIISAKAETSDFTSKSGTSMATPHVAGAWAVMKQSKPTATVDEIEEAFKSTGKSITIAGVSRKRIDIDEALDALSDTDIPVALGIVDACQQGHFVGDHLKAGEAVCIPNFSNGNQFQSEIHVPHDKIGSTMEIILSHGTGNANLLHRHGDRPTRTEYNQISNNSENEERLLIENVQESWNYIHVRADIEFSDVTILVRYVEDSAPSVTRSPTTSDIQVVDACQEGQTAVGNVQLFAGNAVCLQDVSNRGYRQMALYVSDDKVGSTLEILLNHGSGNGILLHRHGARPYNSMFDHISNNLGNEEKILVENVKRGWNYIHVDGDPAFSGVTLLARFIQ